LDRSAKANAVHADMYCSIHINASVSASGNGFETFIYDKTTSSTTKKLQQVMHKNILNSAPYFKDRGMNSANFSVLRNSHMSAILTESGFITNKADSDVLKDAKKITAIAKGHALGIAEFLNLQKKTANTPKTIYKVVVGTYEDIKEATAIKNSLDKDFRNVSIITTKE
jgi:N-acetylmuramoyl-L-alanine amidase